MTQTTGVGKEELFWGRYKLLKSSVGLGLVALGLWLTVQRYVLIQGAAANVVAPIIIMRAEMDGALEDYDLAPGDRLATGRVLGVLRRPRNESSEDVHLANLSVRLREAEAQITSLSSFRGYLTNMTVGLRSGASLYDRHRIDYLRARLQQVNAQIDAERAKEQEAKLKLSRAESLLADGLVSEAGLQQAVREKSVAESGLLAASREADVLNKMLESAGHGINMDPGASERPYSHQRLDDINLRLASLDEALEEKRLLHASISELIDRERERLDRSRALPVTAPADSRVWRLVATKSQHVEKGQTLLELVDCRRVHVVAWVTERNYNRLSIGSPATMSMSQSGATYSGRVVQLMGSQQVGPGRQSAQATRPDLAGFDLGPEADSFAVIVAMDGLAERGNCEVGKTGRITFTAE